jgi:hypothetical protein
MVSWQRQLCSFCPWLTRRAAGHVEQLELYLGRFPGEAAYAKEWTGILAAALACCADKLTVLMLDSNGRAAPLDVSAIVGALGQLRTLTIETAPS